MSGYNDMEPGDFVWMLIFEGIGRLIRAALFDVDGTLVDDRVWKGILEYPKTDRMRVRMLYARTLPHLLRLKLDASYETRFRDQWVRELARLLTAWSVSEAEALAQWIANGFLADAYRQDVIELVAEHKAAGHPVILVSTMFPVVLQAIAERIGADAVVGTAYAVKNGILTGEIEGQSCVGSRKTVFARAFLENNFEGMTLDQCAAYADSFSDVPLLESARLSTAVYPEPGLHQVAVERGWRIHPVN